MAASTGGVIDDSVMNATAGPVNGPTAGSSYQVLLNDRPSWRTSSNNQALNRATSETSSPLIRPTAVGSTQASTSARAKPVQVPSNNTSTVLNEGRTPPAPSTLIPQPDTPFGPNLPEAVVMKSIDPPLAEVESKTLWAAHKCHQIWEGLDNAGKLKFLQDRTLPVPNTPEPPLLCRAMIQSIPDHLRPLFRMVLQGLTEQGMSSMTAVEGINKYLTLYKPDASGRPTCGPARAPTNGRQPPPVRASKATKAAAAAPVSSSIAAAPVSTGPPTASAPAVPSSQRAVQGHGQSAPQLAQTHLNNLARQQTSTQQQQQQRTASNPPFVKPPRLNPANAGRAPQVANPTASQAGPQNARAATVGQPQRAASPQVATPQQKQPPQQAHASPSVLQSASDYQIAQLDTQRRQNFEALSLLLQNELETPDDSDEQQKTQQPTQHLQQQPQLKRAAAAQYASQQQRQESHHTASAATSSTLNAPGPPIIAGHQQLPTNIAIPGVGQVENGESGPALGGDVRQPRHDLQRAVNVVLGNPMRDTVLAHDDSRYQVSGSAVTAASLPQGRLREDQLVLVHQNIDEGRQLVVETLEQALHGMQRSSNDIPRMTNVIIDRQAFLARMDVLARGIDKLRRDLADVTNKYNQTRNDNMRLTQTMDSALSDRVSCYEQIATSSQDNKNLSVTICNLAQTLKELQKSLDESQDELKGTKARNVELNLRVQDHIEGINKANTQLARVKAQLQAELDSLRSKHTAVLKAMQEVKADNIQLKLSLREQIDHADKARAQLANLKSAQQAVQERDQSDHAAKIEAIKEKSLKEGNAARDAWVEERVKEREVAAAELALVKEQLQTALDTSAAEKESTDEMLVELSQEFNQRERAAESEKNLLLERIKRQDEEIKAKDQAVADQAAKVSALEIELAELRAQVEAEAAVDAAVTDDTAGSLFSSSTNSGDPPAPLQPSTITNRSARPSGSINAPSATGPETADVKSVVDSRKRSAPSATPDNQVRPKKPRMTIGTESLPIRSESVASTVHEPNLDSQQRAELAQWALSHLDAGFSLDAKLCKVCYTVLKRETAQRNQQILASGGSEADLEPEANISQLTPFPQETTDEQLTEHLMTEHLAIVAQLKERKQKRLKK